MHALFAILSTLFVTFGLAAPALPTFDVDELVDQVKQEKDGVDPQVFDWIAEYGTEPAFKGLQRATGYIRNEGTLNRAYAAFTKFAGKGELEEDALELLERTAKKARRDEEKRAATRALAKFRPQADALLRKLTGSRDESVRSVAVESILDLLAAEATSEAATLIFENMQLSQSAQRRLVEDTLRQMNSPEVTTYFIKRVEDKRFGLETRLLLLDLLNEREDPAVDDLIVDLLNDRDKVLLLRAVEMAGARSIAAAELPIAGLVDSKENGIARASIVALASIRGEEDSWVREVYELSRSRDFAQRMGAAVALGIFSNSQALERLHEMLEDEVRQVRLEALQSVGNARKRESVPALIGVVRREKARLRDNAATTLRLFTGQDFGLRADSWQRWWDKEGKSTPLPRYEDALAAETERKKKASEGATRTSFYGLQVQSDAVVFILDVSGSMSAPAQGHSKRTSTKRGGATTRLGVAQEELLSVLETFPEGDKFGMIFFSTAVNAWLDELVEMDEDTREESSDYVNRQAADGGTSIYDALEVAFELENLDTIYLLSDGDPSTGKVIDPGNIRLDVQRWNAVRKIEINGIAVGQPSRLLKWLAEDTGGRYVEVL